MRVQHIVVELVPEEFAPLEDWELRVEAIQE
jgi:hypothetical protein